MVAGNCVLPGGIERPGDQCDDLNILANTYTKAYWYGDVYYLVGGGFSASGDSNTTRIGEVETQVNYRAVVLEYIGLTGSLAYSLTRTGVLPPDQEEYYNLINWLYIIFDTGECHNRHFPVPVAAGCARVAAMEWKHNGSQTNYKGNYLNYNYSGNPLALTEYTCLRNGSSVPLIIDPPILDNMNFGSYNYLTTETTQVYGHKINVKQTWSEVGLSTESVVLDFPIVKYVMSQRIEADETSFPGMCILRRPLNNVYDAFYSDFGVRHSSIRQKLYENKDIVEPSIIGCVDG